MGLVERILTSKDIWSR